MKKVLVAADTFSPKKDGVVRFMDEVLPILAKKCRLTIISPDYGRYSKNYYANIIQFPTTSAISAAGYDSVSITRKNLKKIKELVKDSDIVWSQDLAFVGASAIRYGKKYKKPTFAYVHQINWEQFADITTRSRILRKILYFFIKAATRYLYKKCTALMVSSKIIADKLSNENIKGEKIIISPGINVHEFRPSELKAKAKLSIGISPNKTVIAYCGRISREKSLDVLYDAFEIVHKTNRETELVFIGDGPEAKKFTKKNVRITGFVSDVPKYLQAVDIFVMPSTTETTSLATMEAMACAIPVIATPVGKIREFVRNNHNGFIFAKEDVEGLAKRISELVQNPQKRKAMGADARKTMMKYSWNETAEKIAKAFRL